MTLSPFHLALPVNDLAKAKIFYCNVLGGIVAREDEKWLDINFFGHQVSLHLKPEALDNINTNKVDGENIPVRHFGIVMAWDTWHELTNKLNKDGINFIIEPTIRFAGKVGEQATCFIQDPAGNCLEFKSFKDPSQLFAT